MLAITSKGKTIELDVEKATPIKMKKKFAHWGWWVFWVLVCWPVVAVLITLPYCRDDVGVVSYLGEEILLKEASYFELIRKRESVL